MATSPMVVIAVQSDNVHAHGRLDRLPSRCIRTTGHEQRGTWHQSQAWFSAT